MTSAIVRLLSLLPRPRVLTYIMSSSPRESSTSILQIIHYAASSVHSPPPHPSPSSPPILPTHMSIAKRIMLLSQRTPNIRFRQDDFQRLLRTCPTSFGNDDFHMCCKIASPFNDVCTQDGLCARKNDSSLAEEQGIMRSTCCTDPSSDPPSQQSQQPE